MAALNAVEMEFAKVLHEATPACVMGGRMNLGRITPPPSLPGSAGLDTPYWATAGAMRYGAGPWDYGYGTPAGPWPA